jgi:5-formyltetrahydrofolate cyclo-ligase
MGSDDISTAKVRTRRLIAGALAHLAPSRRRAAGVALAQRLAEIPAVREARTLMAFLSLPSEIDTWPIIRWAWSEGKRVVVPRVEPSGESAPPITERTIVPVLLPEAAVESAGAHPAVKAGELGILEVPDGRPVPAAELDVVLAPCQAVDRRGYRLGKGGGFYDRFLARADLRAAVIAVGFQEQVLDEVPVATHDRRVPMVVTDAETISFA